MPGSNRQKMRAEQATFGARFDSIDRKIVFGFLRRRLFSRNRTLLVLSQFYFESLTTWATASRIYQNNIKSPHALVGAFRLYLNRLFFWLGCVVECH